MNRRICSIGFWASLVLLVACGSEPAQAELENPNLADVPADSPTAPTLHGLVAVGDAADIELGQGAGLYHAWDLHMERGGWIALNVSSDTATAQPVIAIYRKHPDGYGDAFKTISVPDGDGAASGVFDLRFARGDYRVLLRGRTLQSQGAVHVAFEATRGDGVRCDSNAPTSGGGDGSLLNPFLLCARAHLASLNQSQKWFVIASDLDLADAPHKPIVMFRGNLDGAGHTISNMSVQAQEAGFFKTNNGTIESLRFENVEIDNDRNFWGHDAGVVAATHGGVLYDVLARGRVSGRGTGGLVGEATPDSIIQACTFDGEVSSKGEIAGGIAATTYGAIIGCETHGRVRSGGRAGGIAGYALWPSQVRFSRSDASIRGFGIDRRTSDGADESIGGGGGIVGHGEGTVIDACEFLGEVVSDNGIGGGIAGRLMGGVLTRSIARGSVTGSSTVGGLIGSEVGSVQISDSISFASVRANDSSGAVLIAAGRRLPSESTRDHLVGIGRVDTSYLPTCSARNAFSVLCESGPTPLYSEMDYYGPNVDRRMFRTSAQMRDVDTYAGFDETIWSLDHVARDGFPTLRWTLDPAASAVAPPPRLSQVTVRTYFDRFATVDFAYPGMVRTYSMNAEPDVSQGALAIIPSEEGRSFAYRYRDDHEYYEISGAHDAWFVIHRVTAPFAEEAPRTTDDRITTWQDMAYRSCRCQESDADFPACRPRPRATEPAPTTYPTHPMITEVDVAQADGAHGEFIELYNRTIPLLTYADYVVLVFSASHSEPTTVVPLSSVTDDYWGADIIVVANAHVEVPSWAIRVDLPDDSLPDDGAFGIALYNVRTHTVMDSMSYGGRIDDVSFDGHTFDCTETHPVSSSVVDNGPGTLSRNANFDDTDDGQADWIYSKWVRPGLEYP